MGCSLLLPIVPSQFATRITGRTVVLSTNFCRGYRQVRLCLTSASGTSRSGRTVSELLDRKWMLPDPRVIINEISFKPGHPGEPLSAPSFSNVTYGRQFSDINSNGYSFYVIRDDLLHPILNGNKARKLDAIMPVLQDNSVTHVVSCGGSQSAHASAVAMACSERGIRPHLLLRGEQPEVPTGYNLITLMFGDVTYIPRSKYAHREEMFRMHAGIVASSDGSVVWLDDLFERSLNDYSPGNGYLDENESWRASLNGAEKDMRKVVVIGEGAGNVAGLLGVVRLVKYLSEHDVTRNEQNVTLVVDAGTGTTAVGLAIGAMCFGLPWKIVAVMLAETIKGYKKKEKMLINDFKRISGLNKLEPRLNGLQDGIVHWVERIQPRRQVARQTGILLDPIYTLAAWEQAACLCRSEEENGSNVIMLHTGGTMNMFGLAQRFKPHFHELTSDFTN
ncbi:pyridoxal-5'-phosphate-dependent enzyme family protein isoform X2 [Wolffia australiana]